MNRTTADDVIDPLAAILGMILTVYSLRFVIWHPFAGPLPGVLSAIAAFGGLLVGVVLLGWGTARLGLVNVGR